MKLLDRLLSRPPLSPQERALNQRRRVVKLAGLLLLSICGLLLLIFMIFMMPGRLSGAELSLIALVGLMLFGSQLVRFVRAINIFRWRR